MMQDSVKRTAELEQHSQLTHRAIDAFYYDTSIPFEARDAASDILISYLVERKQTFKGNEYMLVARMVRRVQDEARVVLKQQGYALDSGKLVKTVPCVECGEHSTNVFEGQNVCSTHNFEKREARGDEQHALGYFLER